MPHHLVGAAEVADMLGVSRQRLGVLALEAADFPLPEVHLAAGRIWRRDAVEAWIAAHGSMKKHGSGKVIRDNNEWPRNLALIFTLAAFEAKQLKHDWVGPEHLVLAVLNQRSPGSGRDCLESAGLNLEEAKQILSHQLGDLFGEPVAGQIVAPIVQVLLERAQLIAARLRDDEASSEHILLAILDDSTAASVLQQMLADRGIDSDSIRDQLLAGDERRPQARKSAGHPARRRERKVERKSLAVRLAKSLSGVHPLRRGPWGSAVFVDKRGRPIVLDGQLSQYLVDRDGHPILSTDQKPVHFAVDQHGRPRLSVDGDPILVEVSVPAGSRMQSVALTARKPRPRNGESDAKRPARRRT